ncbi:MAG: DsrE family protein [Gammaproteobacteria bacterium]|nr:DsrE family protein [Gammaproteobacteria bacterium]
MKVSISTLVVAGLLAILAMNLSTSLAANKSFDAKKEAKNGYHQQRVVYHISDIKNAADALRNAKNHLDAVGDENIEIVVVTHSSGAFALVDGAMGEKDKEGKPMDFRDEVAGLANRGVKFQICANTIKGKKIPKEKISEFAEIVPSGVAQVAELEEHGYVYVKP